MSAFSTLEVLDDTCFAVTFDTSWNQGRGAFGGLLAATLARVARRRWPGWPLRALSFHLCAPAVGRLVVELVEQRRGTATLFASARILGPDGPVLLASLTLGKARVDAVDYCHAKPPVLPSAASLPDVFAMLGEGATPGVPAFTQHFEFRMAQGIPYTNQALPVTRGWIRPRDPTAFGEDLVWALLDAWPLAVLCTLSTPRPVASVAIHMNRFADPAAIASDAFYCVDMSSDVNDNGYSDQQTSLYAPTGALLGRANQLVAVIR